MAVYAIGDIQGCLDSLLQLLDKLGPSSSDQLWFTGDLVNRGPKSLETLRFVRSLGGQAVSVLGNHDLHLLALSAGRFQEKPNPTLQPVLHAEDCDELLGWLRHRPLLHSDPQIGWTMVHAGVHPRWDIGLAQQLANESEALLRGPAYEDFMQHLYGNHPENWGPELTGYDRARFTINVMTRMRFCGIDGRLDFLHKGAPGSQPSGFLPWFEINRESPLLQRVVFGHWSALGLHRESSFYGIDTGCLWGGQLSALRLDEDDPHITAVDCVRHEKAIAK